MMGSVKWAAVLASVVTVALDTLANLLLEIFTPHAVPDVVNLFAMTLTAVGAVIAFGAHIAIRFDAKFNLVVELLTTRLEELENRIGDRNTGFVEGYMLSHPPEASIPEAPVVQLAPRGPRRVHHGED
jgi:predicted PurR-regulated permease PerM